MSLGALVRNSEEILRALYVSVKFMQREPEAFLSPPASPQPKECIGYKCSSSHSLNVQMNLQGHPGAVPSAWPPRAGTAPGHRDCLGASTPKASSHRCWVEGQQEGLHRGDPVTPMSQCHHPAMQTSQCPGWDKREHPPVSRCQRWPGDSLETSKGKFLRSHWRWLREEDQRLDKVPGGSLLQGQLPEGPRSKRI